MSRKSSLKSRVKSAASLPVIRPNAAGIDIGSRIQYVCVPNDRAEQNVRSFGSFTEDLNMIADWLTECKVETVAMESTGVYWIPLYTLLEERGFEVFLVNSKHFKNTAAKSDNSDCRWLQLLHAVGLLQGSFRPKEHILELRSVVRYRDALVVDAAAFVQRIQKALTQMNFQIHHAISDIVGLSGLAILDAILAGERDPKVLAKLCDRRIKASEQTIIKSLEGTYRREHLFEIKISLEMWRTYQQAIRECDAELEDLLSRIDSKLDPEAQPYVPSKSARKKAQKNEVKLPESSLAQQMYRIFGTDLTLVPGLGPTSVHALFSEIGQDMSAFPTSKAFVSWLGLCPDNRISGGKKLSVKTKKTDNRAAQTFRIAAFGLHKSDTYLGAYYRRTRARLGAPKAVTAAARKLATIVFHLVTTREQYDESVFTRAQERYDERKFRALTRSAISYGYQLMPINT